MVEIARDREPAVGLLVSPEAIGEVGLGAIRGHRELARDGEAVYAEPLDELELDVVPREGEPGGRGGRCDGRDVIDAVRPLEHDLERDHPPERPAGDEREALDAERVGE